MKPFENDDVTIDYYDISLAEFNSKTMESVGNHFVFKFLWLSSDGKHLMRFLIETSVFKFLRRGVKGP